MSKYFIILGTEKSGTTSLFEYFGMHPAVTASVTKETDYFRNTSVREEDYISKFNKPSSSSKYLMEGSPGYLGLASEVIPRIANTLNDRVKLAAVLRDPIERLRSSFLFHKSKLYIPETLCINEYVDLCLRFDRQEINLLDTPFDNPWFLNVLPAGKYKRHILSVLENYSKESLHLVDFQTLKREPHKTVVGLCDFLGIDGLFFNNFDFFKSNETFQPDNKFIHRAGMAFNKYSESFFRKHPELKRKAVKFYRLVNENKTPVKENFSPASIAKLVDYYRDDYLFMKDYFNTNNVTIIWNHFNDE